MSAWGMRTPEPSQLPRRAERKPFAASVQCRRGMSRETVEVIDISACGARVRALVPLRAGHPVWLRLPRLEPIEARVVWTSGCESGCEFVRALHPAVFEAIAKDA